MKDLTMKINQQSNITIPEQVKQIIEKLENNGYEAFIVGGCVRDTLMDRIPEDWDITTSASPEQIKALFRRTIDTGIQHGTVTVMFDNVGYEVTTSRIDGIYEDHRHPKEVLFTENLIEDLRRRDFTINAMAYSPGKGMVDAFHGKEDLDNKLIRAVGNAEERFSEDALRMLRAIRFAGQLHFTIEQDTKEGIYKLAPTICHVSAERIRAELVKLLISDGSEYFSWIRELGLSAFFLPEWEGDSHSLAEVREVNRLCECRTIPKKQRIALVFAALLHEDVKAEQAKEICRRLTFDNDTIKMVELLIGFYHKEFKEYNVVSEYDMQAKNSEVAMRFAMHEIGVDILPFLFLIREADILAKGKNNENMMENQKYLELTEAKHLFKNICSRNEPITMKDLVISGNDLQKLGVPCGPGMGKLLKYLMEQVLVNPEYNNKDMLKTLALQKVTMEKQEGNEECH